MVAGHNRVDGSEAPEETVIFTGTDEMCKKTWVEFLPMKNYQGVYLYDTRLFFDPHIIMYTYYVLCKHTIPDKFPSL